MAVLEGRNTRTNDLGKGTFLWKGFVKVVETSDGFLFLST